MWHSSAAPLKNLILPPGLLEVRLRDHARAALQGVGDASLGEWEEWSGQAYHVRRRLTTAEQKVVGEAIDIRNTPEAERRYQRMQPYLPSGYPLV